MKVLFVCSGNICRSPMAHGMMVQWADLAGVPVEDQSAGTLGLVDRAAAPKAVAACREIGNRGPHQRNRDWLPAICHSCPPRQCIRIDLPTDRQRSDWPRDRLARLRE